MGRITNFLLLAIPLALIFRRLRISNIEIMFLLQILFFPHQSVWAGEWIFKNIEEKTFAYIFIFWSIYYLLKDKPALSIVFSAGATYFHFLVGGWMFLFVFFYFLFRKNIRRVIIPTLLYATLVLPLVIYLAMTYLIDNSAIINGVNTNAVYSFFRLRHHIGMFGNGIYFFSTHFGGVFLSSIMFALCIFAFRKIKDDAVSQLNTLNIIIFTQQFLFIIIGLFDKNGTFMKTYPFRTSSLSALLFILEATLIIKIFTPKMIYSGFASKYLKNKSVFQKKILYANGINLILFIFLIPQVILETGETFKNRHQFNERLDREMIELIQYAKERTPIQSVFLLADDDMPYSFIRRSRRDRFVMEKFTPTSSRSIYEWHKRILLKERIKKRYISH